MDFIDNFKEMSTFFPRLLSEPACDVKVALEQPIPQWLLSLMVANEVLRGKVRTCQEWLKIFTLLMIASRIECLMIALIAPLVMGKCSTWCRRAEYMYGVLCMMLMIYHAIAQIASQMQHLTPECMRTMDVLMNARIDALRTPGRFKRLT